MYNEDVKLINQMSLLQIGNIMNSDDLKQA